LSPGFGTAENRPASTMARGFSTQDMDAFVGARVARRRKEIGQSQSALSGQLGISVQQLQKYENGKNRIGAGCLFEIAAILGVPVPHFFPGRATDVGKGVPEEAAELLRAFGRIPDAASSSTIKTTAFSMLKSIVCWLNSEQHGLKPRVLRTSNVGCVFMGTCPTF
jgi:transcriptional regulator with XRE-family HTH domain